jgi:hypothetical protein
MKNIQVIDGALNCTFSIFQATDEEFALVFPEHGQELQYAEDVPQLPRHEQVEAALRRLWDRPVLKREACGIHGTYFVGLLRYKGLYREKREDAVDPSAVNQAQRRLFRIEE